MEPVRKLAKVLHSRSYPRTMTIFFYYHGNLKHALENGLYGFTTYSLKAGLGDIIRSKQLAMDNIRQGMRKELMLIIKPADGSKYENVVNTLDEVLINDVFHYAIVDISREEK